MSKEKTILLNPKLKLNVVLTTKLMSMGYTIEDIDTDPFIEIVGIAFEDHEDNMHILIDSQEPPEVISSFENEGYIIHRKQIKEGVHRLLDVADLKMKAGVELKRIADFIASISDGRLFIQAAKMFYSNMRTCFIIVGDHFSGDSEFMHKILGAQASIAAQYRIPIMHVKNNEDAAYLAARFIEKGSNPKAISSTYNIISSELKKESQVVANIMSVEGIGELIAKNIAREVKSIDNLISLLKHDEKRILKIEKVGKGKLQSLKNAYLSEWVDPEPEIQLEDPQDSVDLDIIVDDNIDLSF